MGEIFEIFFKFLSRSSREDLIKKRLKVLSQQQRESGDIIDETIKEKCLIESMKLCTKCGAENESSYKSCRNCGETSLVKQLFNFANQKQGGSKISDIFSCTVNATRNDAKVLCGEPDLRNPNSYENITIILRNIAIRSGIQKYVPTGKRHWMFLEVDGAIYTIVDELIKNTFRCCTCSVSYYSKDVYTDHGCEDLKYEREFDWIILFPG